MGHIYYFFVEDWAYATEYRHETGIRDIYADPAGTRLVFFDDKGHGYVFNPVSFIKTLFKCGFVNCV